MPTSSPRTARRRARPVASGSARPRPLQRGLAVPAEPERPMAVPFAAAFGFLVAAEGLYPAWLLWGLWWYVAGAGVLAAAAVTGAVLVLRGRGRGWVVLALASVVLLLALLLLAFLVGALGGGAELVWALLLLVGPIGCLALTLRRPVRQWTTPDPGRRPAGGRRTSAMAR